MRHFTFAIAVLVAGAAVQPAVAQEDRYTLERSGDRLIRMDNRTGEMAICEERGTQLVCRLAADERSAMQNDIDEMAARIDALEGRLAALERGQTSAPAAGGLPSEEEVEGAFSLMERFFRRFMGVMRDLERDFGRDAPPEATPERT